MIMTDGDDGGDDDETFVQKSKNTARLHCRFNLRSVNYIESPGDRTQERRPGPPTYDAVGNNSLQDRRVLDVA